MKRKFLATAMAIVCTLSLAACGGDSGDGDKEPGSSNPGGSSDNGGESTQEDGNDGGE